MALLVAARTGRFGTAWSIGPAVSDETTAAAGRPDCSTSQALPAVLRNRYPDAMLPLSAPATNVNCGELAATVMAEIESPSRPAPCQACPSGLMSTPLSVPTATPSRPKAMARTSVFVRPVDDAPQVVPPSPLAKTPFPAVPANASCAVRASKPTTQTRTPARVSRQVEPPSVVVYTPLSVPARIVWGCAWFTAMPQSRPEPSPGSGWSAANPAAAAGIGPPENITRPAVAVAMATKTAAAARLTRNRGERLDVLWERDIESCLMAWGALV